MIIFCSIMNFKFIEKIDVTNIKSKLKDLDWDSFDWRIKNSQGSHSETKSVPIIFDENRKEPIKQENYILFSDTLNDIKNIFQKTYGDGILFTALLINLPAGKRIKSHIDVGENFDLSHRVHIPIITNDRCFFSVDEEIKNMKEGEMWEIDNNGKYHWVSNEGETDRIHLLVDWKATKKEKTII